MQVLDAEANLQKRGVLQLRARLAGAADDLGAAQEVQSQDKGAAVII
jgi:hypothetical protein